MTERRESSDQLDLFRQPAEPMPALDPAEPLEGDVVRVPLRPAAVQLTELKGETWEDAFGDAA